MALICFVGISFFQSHKKKNIQLKVEIIILQNGIVDFIKKKESLRGITTIRLKGCFIM